MAKLKFALWLINGILVFADGEVSMLIYTLTWVCLMIQNTGDVIEDTYKRRR